MHMQWCMFVGIPDHALKHASTMLMCGALNRSSFVLHSIWLSAKDKHFLVMCIAVHGLFFVYFSKVASQPPCK